MSGNPYAAWNAPSQHFVGPRLEDSVMELRAVPDPFGRANGYQSQPLQRGDANPYQASSPSQQFVNGNLRYPDSVYEIHNLPRQFASGNPYNYNSPDNSELTDASAGDETLYDRNQLPDPFVAGNDKVSSPDNTIRNVKSLTYVTSETRTGRDFSERDYLPASAFAPEMHKAYQHNNNDFMRNNRTQRRLAYAYPPGSEQQSYSFGNSVKSWRPSVHSSYGSDDTRVVNGIANLDGPNAVFPQRKLKRNNKKLSNYNNQSANQIYPPGVDSETFAEHNEVPDMFDSGNPYTVEDRFECQRTTNRNLRTGASQYELNAHPEFAGQSTPRKVRSHYSDSEATFREINKLPNMFEQYRPYQQTSSQYFALPGGGQAYIMTTDPTMKVNYQQAVPVNYQYQQAVPVTYQQIPVNYQQVPVTYQQVPINYQQVPANYTSQVYANPYEGQYAQQRPAHTESSLVDLNNLPDMFNQMCRFGAEAFTQAYVQAANNNNMYQAPNYRAPANVQSPNPYAQGTTYNTNYGAQPRSDPFAQAPMIYLHPYEQESYFRDNQRRH